MWFHLTGGARVGKQSWVGQPAGQSVGGRVSGEAVSWREAGERLNGYLACQSYSRNTVTCYLGWARRFFRWCSQSGKDLPEVAASDSLAFVGMAVCLWRTESHCGISYRAPDPLACPREYGRTPSRRLRPALWRLASGDVSLAATYVCDAGTGKRH